MPALPCRLVGAAAATPCIRAPVRCLCPPPVHPRTPVCPGLLEVRACSCTRRAPCPAPCSRWWTRTPTSCPPLTKASGLLAGTWAPRSSRATGRWAGVPHRVGGARAGRCWERAGGRAHSHKALAAAKQRGAGWSRERGIAGWRRAPPGCLTAGPCLLAQPAVCPTPPLLPVPWPSGRELYHPCQLLPRAAPPAAPPGRRHRLVGRQGGLTARRQRSRAAGAGWPGRPGRRAYALTHDSPPCRPAVPQAAGDVQPQEPAAPPAGQVAHGGVQRDGNGEGHPGARQQSGAGGGGAHMAPSSGPAAVGSRHGGLTRCSHQPGMPAASQPCVCHSPSTPKAPTHPTPAAGRAVQARHHGRVLHRPLPRPAQAVRLQAYGVLLRQGEVPGCLARVPAGPPGCACVVRASNPLSHGTERCWLRGAMLQRPAMHARCLRSVQEQVGCQTLQGRAAAAGKTMLICSRCVAPRPPPPPTHPPTSPPLSSPGVL